MIEVIHSHKVIYAHIWLSLLAFLYHGSVGKAGQGGVCMQWLKSRDCSGER